MPTPHVQPALPEAREHGVLSPKPFLVPPTGFGVEEAPLRQPVRGLRALLHGWHLWSLDAPTIATLWTALIAHAAGVRLPASSLSAMFLAVWMLYAADRLLDARPLRNLRGSRESAIDQMQGLELEPRHRFHHQHRAAFLVVLVGVTGMLGVLLPTLSVAALRLDLLLGALLAGYFVMIHAIEGVRLPKEIAVGLFFAAAVFIPTVSRRPELRPGLALVAVLFAGVCSLNCVAIYRWEHTELPSRTIEDDRAEVGRPHAVTRWAMNHLQPIGYCLLVMAIATAIVPGSGRPDAIAIAAAAGALLWLDRGRERFAPVTLRALADLALATPLFVWPMTAMLLRR